MGIANIPFPSFTLVLTSDRVVIPGPSFVIRLAPLVLHPHPHSPQATVLMTNNINLNNDDLMEEDYPLANLDLESDSTTDVALGHSDPEEPRSRYESDHDQEQVRNKLSFPFLKMRPTARFRLKNPFKRLPMPILTEP